MSGQRLRGTNLESFSLTNISYIKQRLELGKVIYPNGCWGYYNGSLDQHRQIGLANKVIGLHIIAGYAYLDHNINDELMTLHKCGNGGCWNPEHLYRGSFVQNMEDCIKEGKFPPSNKTHCKNGHEFTSGSYRIRRGWRECLKCVFNSRRARYVRQRKRKT